MEGPGQFGLEVVRVFYAAIDVLAALVGNGGLCVERLAALTTLYGGCLRRC